jgi:hypothetical protein
MIAASTKHEILIGIFIAKLNVRLACRVGGGVSPPRVIHWHYYVVGRASEGVGV